MTETAPKKVLDAAAKRLRAEVLARDEGAFVGSEESLEPLLGVSRPTMRQAARMLEREGLLRVKRRNNGGYFGTRPDQDFIEATVSTYLEVLHAEPEDLTMIASVLWTEVVRKAAALRTDASRELVARFRGKVKNLPDTATFTELQEVELKIRKEIFELIKSPYVELIFKINATFARRHSSGPPSARDDGPLHLEFVVAWRKAKLIELDAIADGDEELAQLAARRTRGLLQRRLWPTS